MKVMPVDTLAARMAEAVIIVASHQGYRAPAKPDIETLRALIADWVDANLGPARAEVHTIARAPLAMVEG